MKDNGKKEAHDSDEWFVSEKEQEYYSKIIQQTSEETVGIPTPPDQEDMAATDGVSEFVEKIMDEIQKSVFPDDKDSQ